MISKELRDSMDRQCLLDIAEDGQVLLAGEPCGVPDDEVVTELLSKAPQEMMTASLRQLVWRAASFYNVCPACGHKNFHWHTQAGPDAESITVSVKIGSCLDCGTDCYMVDEQVYTQHVNKTGYVIWYNSFADAKPTQAHKEK